MTHDILGKIDLSDGHPFDATAVIPYCSRDIKVVLIQDDQLLETTINLAAEVVSRLAELDQLAKKIAVAELRETYNSGWNAFDEVQEDGTVKTVTNPQLSEAEFEGKLSLQGVNVTGDRMIDFYYDDDRMFWGHSIVVSSLNGLDFTDAYAELVG